MERTCKTCSKSFTSPASQVKIGFGLFCSRSCRTKSFWKEGKIILKSGKEHHNWKGNKVGYRALHLWIETKLGKPLTCTFCKKRNLKGRNIHWANKSGNYLRDLSDWLRLCTACHGKYDRSRRG